MKTRQTLCVNRSSFKSNCTSIEQHNDYKLPSITELLHNSLSSKSGWRKGQQRYSSPSFPCSPSRFQNLSYEPIQLRTCIQQCFKKAKGMPVAEKIELILLNAANGEQYGSLHDLQQHLDPYKENFDFAQLHVQLQIMPSLLQARNEKHAGEPPIRRVTKVRTCVDVLKVCSSCTSPCL